MMTVEDGRLLFGPVLHGATYYSVTRQPGVGVVVWTVPRANATMHGRDMVQAWDRYEPTVGLDQVVQHQDWFADWLLAEWGD